VEFRILGPLEVEDDGRVLPLGGSKQRALLALLLLHANQVVSRDRLIDEVWGDRAPKTAAAALQGYVSGLRKALGARRILTRAPGYLLQVEPNDLDLGSFDRLARAGREALANGDAERASQMFAEALALWRGPPLADLDVAPFAYAERLRLEESRLTAIEERIEAELALGRHAAVVAELEALVAGHPLREKLRGQLMLALYRSGRQAEALQVYQEARRLLVGELGLEPGTALRSLQQAILNHESALEPRPHTTAARTVRPRRRAAAALGAFLAAAVVAGAVVLLTRTHQPFAVVPDSLVKIDARTNQVVDVVRVGRNPGKVVAGYGAVWVVNDKDETLTRVGLRSGHAVLVGGLRLAAPAGLAVAGGRGLFVGSFAESKVVAIDPRALGVAERIRIPGSTALFLAAGAGSLWITQPPADFHASAPAAISRISILNDKIQNRFTVPGGVLPGQIAFGARAAWVAKVGDGTVWRIDAATNSVRRIRVGSQPTDIAVGFGSAWVPCLGRNAVWRLNAATGKTEAIIPAGEESLALAIGAGAVWVTNQAAGTVSRIDPRTNKVVKTIRLGFNPHGIAVADGAVWVAVARELI
jgi:YVTN family beta-propeller protein